MLDLWAPWPEITLPLVPGKNVCFPETILSHAARLCCKASGMGHMGLTWRRPSKSRTLMQQGLPDCKRGSRDSRKLVFRQMPKYYQLSQFQHQLLKVQNLTEQPFGQWPTVRNFGLFTGPWIRKLGAHSKTQVALILERWGHASKHSLYPQTVNFPEGKHDCSGGYLSSCLSIYRVSSDQEWSIFLGNHKPAGRKPWTHSCSETIALTPGESCFRAVSRSVKC